MATQIVRGFQRSRAVDCAKQIVKHQVDRIWDKSNLIEELVQGDQIEKAKVEIQKLQRASERAFRMMVEWDSLNRDRIQHEIMEKQAEQDASAAKSQEPESTAHKAVEELETIPPAVTVHEDDGEVEQAPGTDKDHLVETLKEPVPVRADDIPF